MSKTRTKTVRIDKTRHRSQPYKITELGTVDKERKERYVTERTASIGAVRACRDFMAKGPSGVYDARVRIMLPGGRERFGYLWTTGQVKLDPITKSKSTKKKK